MSPGETRILVVDDHQLFLEGMRHLLMGLGPSSEVELVETVEKAIARLDSGVKFHLIIMDLELPQVSGYALLKSLNERGVLIPTLVISATTDLDDIHQVLKLGALGYIHKNSSSEEMLAAVRKVMGGEVYLSDDVWPRMKIYPTALKEEEAEAEHQHEGVGERQIEVLRLVEDGLSNKQIAKVLNIGESTVKYHIGILFKHFSVVSRTGLIREAQKSDSSSS